MLSVFKSESTLLVGGGGGDFKACLLLCSTSHDQSQSEPCQTIITCFPGYSGGIKVQVQDGPTIFFPLLADHSGQL